MPKAKLQIKNLEHAKQVLDALHARFAEINMPAPAGTTENTAKGTVDEIVEKSVENTAKETVGNSPEKTAKDTVGNHPEKTEPIKLEPKQKNMDTDQAARIIQQQWRKIRETDKTIAVRAGKKHKKQFHYFLNQTQPKKSLNKTKLAALQHALKMGDWNNPVFADEQLEQLAMSLLASDRMTDQQMFTILERQAITRYTQIIETCPLLDSENCFTERALHIIQRKLPHSIIPLNWSDESNWSSNPNSKMLPEDLESLRLLIAALPKSEQIIYITNHNHLLTNDTENSTIANSTLIRNIYHYDPIHEHLAFPSAGLRDALGVLYFGLDDYVRPYPRLGIQTREDIEFGVANRMRPAVANYPGIKAYENIHGAKNISDFIALLHDYYHAAVSSSIPQKMHKTMDHFIKIIRETFGMKWSKETWTWIDRELYEFSEKFSRYGYVDADQLTNQKFTELFCKLIFAEYNRGQAYEELMGTYFFQHNQISTAGLAILIDMAKNPDQWKTQFNLDPIYLLDPFAKYYKMIQAILPKLINPDPKLEVLTALAYLTLLDYGKEKLFPVVADHIAEFGKDMLQDITIQKVSRKNAKDLGRIENSIFLALGDDEFNINSIRKILSYYEPKEAGPHFAAALLDHDLTLKQAHAYASRRYSGISEQNALKNFNTSMFSSFQRTMGKLLPDASGIKLQLFRGHLPAKKVIGIKKPTASDKKQAVNDTQQKQPVNDTQHKKTA